MSSLPDGDTEHRHPSLEEGQAKLRANQQEIRANQQEILDVLAGPVVHEFGRTDVRRGGLVETVHEINARTKNGMRLDLPTWTKLVAFLVTLMNLVLVILLIIHETL